MFSMMPGNSSFFLISGFDPDLREFHHRYYRTPDRFS